MGALCSTPAPSPVLTGVPAGLDFHERALSAQAVPGVISDYQRDLKLLMEGALAAMAYTAANGAGAAGQGEAPPPATADPEPAVGNWEVQPSVAHVPGLSQAWGYLPGVPGPVVVSRLEVEADADALFRFLVSVEGFKVIDPDTKNHEEPPVESFPWGRPEEGDRAEMAYAVSRQVLPLVWPRVFLAFNAMDYGQRLFLSVPATDPRFPKEEEPKLRRARGLNVWANWVLPGGVGGGGDGTKCTLVSLLWLSMGGTFPQSLTDKICTQAFMPAFHKRLIKAVAQRPHLQAATTAAIFLEPPPTTDTKAGPAKAAVEEEEETAPAQPAVVAVS